jgi:hypothetical protein
LGTYDQTKHVVEHARTPGDACAINARSAEPSSATSSLFLFDHELWPIESPVLNSSCLRIRPKVRGEATTACASDSKKFGAWDQNLMTEWHVRCVMIYWHMEKHSVCGGSASALAAQNGSTLTRNGTFTLNMSERLPLA